MPRQKVDRSEDIADLKILHCVDVLGLTYAQTAERFRCSRAKVAGFCQRIKQIDEPCACEKPENQDGGMPDRWWQ